MGANVQRRYGLSLVAFSAVALAHALLSWSPRAVLALYLGGAAVAFVPEAAVVRLGLLRHRLRPQVAGVPLVVLATWPSVVYVLYGVAVVVVAPGVQAAALAALVGTLVDLVVDPYGVRDGAWAYPEAAASSPRLGGVPWWNFAGWPVIVFATAMIPALVG